MPSSSRSADPAPTRRLLPYGDRAVLVECADLGDAQALHRWLEAERPGAVTEIVPGARTLLLRLGAPPTDPAVRRLTGRLLELDLARTDDRPRSGEVADVVVDVDYDGADLEEVAALLGVEPATVVTRHTGRLWTVAFCGFAPGFGYLAGRDDLVIPRRTSPRTRVPAGSVGLADRWSGIYPRAAPGGWQLIGRTDRPVWDLDADPPALLRPGMRVRFRDRAAGPGTSDGTSDGPVR